jgi:ubiquinone/menaquinone biosynthesis C-methylase UbiE
LWKWWACRRLKIILQNQKNPKHYDDRNRAMRTGGQKLWANEMQSFALNNNKEITPEKTCQFSMILWLGGTRF